MTSSVEIDFIERYRCLWMSNLGVLYDKTNLEKVTLKRKAQFCSLSRVEKRSKVASDVVDLTEDTCFMQKHKDLDDSLRGMTEDCPILIRGESCISFRTYEPGYFAIGRILLNKLSEDCTNANTVSMRELVYKKNLLSVLISTFTLSPGAVTSLFEDVLSSDNFSELVIITHYDTERDCCGLQSGKMFPSSLPNNKIKIIFPRFESVDGKKYFPCKTSIQHSKLLILEYSSHIRIVISSMNMTQSLSSQIIFVVDVPIETNHLSTKSNCTSFGVELSAFIERLSPFKEVCSESWSTLRRWCRLCEKGDYFLIRDRFQLVSSTPGNFPPDCESVGLTRLQYLIRNSKISVSTVDSYSSSIGAVATELIPQLTNVLRIDTKQFSVIWPSIFQVLQDETIMAKACLFITKNDLVFGEKDVSKFKPLMIEPDRRSYMIHAKVICGYSSDSISFVYVGSHNLSQNAWGSWKFNDEGTRVSFRCSSFELGIFCCDKRELSSLRLPFILTSRTYSDLVKDRSNLHCSLLRIGKEITPFGKIVVNHKHKSNIWLPFSAMKLAELRRCSEIVAIQTKLHLRLLKYTSRATSIIFFVNHIKDMKTLNINCSFSGVSILCVDLSQSSLSTLAFLYNVLSKVETLQRSSFPIAIRYDLNLSEVLLLTSKDAKVSGIISSEELSYFKRSMTNRIYLTREYKGVYSVKVKEIECISGCLSCIYMKAKTKSIFIPKQVLVRNELLTLLSSRYDTFIFSEVYKPSSLKMKSGGVKLLRGVSAFLKDLGEEVMKVTKRKRCIFLLRLPEVGRTHYDRSRETLSNHVKLFGHKRDIFDDKAAEFLHIFELVVQQFLGKHVIVEIHGSYLYRSNGTTFPALDTIQDKVSKKEWDPCFSTPSCDWLTHRKSKELGNICFFGRNREDKLAARNLSCPYFLLRDIVREWRGIQSPTVSIEKSSVSALLQEADEWLSKS